LSLIIKPYKPYSETDKILYFSEVGKIFKAKDDIELLPVNPMDTYKILVKEFDRYDPMASVSLDSTQGLDVSPPLGTSPDTQLKHVLPQDTGAGVSVPRELFPATKAGTKAGPKAGLGGSSTRSRRRNRRNHRRTQYTNKHKRSSKSTKHATIKHRKSYRKHNRTIKRHKSRRHH
jgi:hypothetical protein